MPTENVVRHSHSVEGDVSEFQKTEDCNDFLKFSQPYILAVSTDNFEVIICIKSYVSCSSSVVNLWNAENACMQPD